MDFPNSSGSQIIPYGLEEFFGGFLPVLTRILTVVFMYSEYMWVQMYFHGCFCV